MRQSVQKLYEKLKERLNVDEEPTSELIAIMNDLYQELQKECERCEIGEVCNDLYRHIQKEKVYMTVCLFSFVLELERSPEVMEEFITYVTYDPTLHYINKNFLFYQIARMIFMNSEFETEKVLTAKWKLLKKLKDEIKAEIRIPLQRIPKEQRNENMAVVITAQYLSETHGPTKTALDRCAALKRELKKEVLLINTAEFMPEKGYIPMFRCMRGNYNPQLCEKETQFWKGIEIPFFQCDKVMPDSSVYEMLLSVINRLKPGIVVNIGGSSVFAGLVNDMLPVLTVGTTQSGLVTTLTEYQTSYGNIGQNWLRALWNVGKSENHMIEGRFTFSLREQTETTSRRQEKLPENQFLLAVVGGRLDYELTEEFFLMLEQVLSEEIGIVFIGPLATFGAHKQRHPGIGKYMYYFGPCEDVLSKLEICDLYVNPTRKGGGTSVIEAMSKGKPAVSVAYGDVAGIIGGEFCCGSYEEMADLIKKYRSDAGFYAQKSKEALRLAEEYMDTKKEFIRIIHEYEKRKDTVF